DIAAKVHSEITKALKSPEVSELITREGGTPIGSTPDEFASYFRRDADKYAQVIRAGKLKSD
ncbi:MAG: tripartite tricarboxylate transporter substrate binding protein, partial [Betaproteobacteria bacterium]|nr:tripartite tricarboxylate transporter substrate binding protein [Betaproteobacteria bacterium]